ncbi:MAG: hypothetical protein IEMM0008_0051 [bacterium]|nr:MAG: hypothetical protein IEMM0008_0051 [bacterium]
MRIQHNHPKFLLVGGVMILGILFMLNTFPGLSAKPTGNIAKKPAKSGTDSSSKSVQKKYGIPPIILGLTLQSLEGRLKKIDPSFSGLKSTLEDHYFQRIPKLKGKKVKHPLILVKGDRVYYKNVIEYLLISSKEKDKKLSGTHYKPVKRIFKSTRIHPKINKIHLKFHDQRLYECQFTLKLNVNEMNNLIALYHKKMGEKSLYEPVAETYTWTSKYYEVSLSLGDRFFPRDITLKFIHLKYRDMLWEDFRKVKKELDKVLRKSKGSGVGDL